MMLLGKVRETLEGLKKNLAGGNMSLGDGFDPLAVLSVFLSLDAM